MYCHSHYRHSDVSSGFVDLVSEKQAEEKLSPVSFCSVTDIKKSDHINRYYQTVSSYTLCLKENNVCVIFN